MSIAYIKDQFVEASQASISIDERGFRFGDGIFETIKIIDSQLQYLDLHLARLQRGLADIKIKYDVKDLGSLTEELIKKNNIQAAFLRISVSRGIGSYGYLPADGCEPLLIMQIIPEKEKTTGAKELMISSYKIFSANSHLTSSKSMQGLTYGLVAMEAKQRGFYDAIILNEKDDICETSAANIFWKKGNKYYTPDLESGCVAGIWREVFIKENPGKVITGNFKISELDAVDELFLSNVAHGKLLISRLKR
jgi:branched-subunit amino acid aminotransferase/4-amino-4-deoxychorismate lyase